jgi:hypothetical protein
VPLLVVSLLVLLPLPRRAVLLFCFCDVLRHDDVLRKNSTSGAWVI